MQRILSIRVVDKHNEIRDGYGGAAGLLRNMAVCVLKSEEKRASFWTPAFCSVWFMPGTAAAIDAP